MVSHPTEDGFHEIQLNGKQLVFLFMAATVVSVVIFLCGVLVGRGVRAERTVEQTAALNEAPPDILPSAPASAPPAIQAGADPRDAAPPAPIDEKSAAVTEEVLPDSAKAQKAPVSAEPPAPTTSVAKAEKSERPGKADRLAKADKAPGKPAPATKPLAEPVAAASVKEPARPPAPVADAPTPADGYAVQVAAVNGRTDADAIARRFSSKGYSAYVEQPPHGTGTVFRVRIGTFKTKREAETIAAKLQKEEQIKPWVTR